MWPCWHAPFCRNNQSILSLATTLINDMLANPSRRSTKQHSLCLVHFAKATHMNEVVTLGRPAFLEGSERFPHEATCTGMSRSLRGSLRILVCMVCPVLWLCSNKSTNVRTPALIRHSSTTTQARSCGSQRSASHNPQGVHWSCPWCPFRHSCELSS